MFQPYVPIQKHWSSKKWGVPIPGTPLDPPLFFHAWNKGVDLLFIQDLTPFQTTYGCKIRWSMNSYGRWEINPNVDTGAADPTVSSQTIAIFIFSVYIHQYIFNKKNLIYVFLSILYNKEKNMQQWMSDYQKKKLSNQQFTLY